MAAKDAAELAKVRAEAEATAANVKLALEVKSRDTAKLPEKDLSAQGGPREEQWRRCKKNRSEG